MPKNKTLDYCELGFVSLDLNYIEHLWKELKYSIWRRPPSNLRQLEQRVGQNIFGQEQEFIRQLQKSFDCHFK